MAERDVHWGSRAPKGPDRRSREYRENLSAKESFNKFPRWFMSKLVADGRLGNAPELSFTILCYLCHVRRWRDNRSPLLTVVDLAAKFHVRRERASKALRWLTCEGAISEEKIGRETRFIVNLIDPKGYREENSIDTGKTATGKTRCPIRAFVRRTSIDEDVCELGSQRRETGSQSEQNGITNLEDNKPGWGSLDYEPGAGAEDLGL